MVFKPWYAAMVAAFSFTLLVPAASAQSLREELLFSVVQVLAINEDGDSFVGSGTTISEDDGLVLTNYHVVADAETETSYSRILLCYTVSQTLLPKCSATAKIIALNKEYDLALIMPDRLVGQDGKTTKKSFQKLWKKQKHKFYAVPFKNTAFGAFPSILDSITIWGYPAIGGSTITVSAGFVSGFDLQSEGKDTNVKFIKTDTSINPGNSGGAAFDSYFYFIGIPTKAYPGQLGFLTPIETAVQWFESLDREGVIRINDIESMGTYGVSFPDIHKDDALQKVAGLLRYLKIMGGYPDGNFRPDIPLSKAEAITIVVSASRAKIQKSNNHCVSTLDSESWYSASVCYAKEKGWTDPEMLRNFSAPISEDDFAVIFNRAFPATTIRSFSRQTISRRSAAHAVFSLLAP